MRSDAEVRLTAGQALGRLREGNERFIRNERSIESIVSHAVRGALVSEQRPFAILLSCSDSGVPSEALFDCRLGDLFVVRVAGNSLEPSVVGSIEFAVATFEAELVIVLGHENCRTVQAAIAALDSPGADPISDNVRSVVGCIADSLSGMERNALPAADRLAIGIRSNVRAAASHLRERSNLLDRRIAEGRLRIVVAEERRGAVNFIEDAQDVLARRAV